MFFADPRTHAVPSVLETKQLLISFLLFKQMSLLMYNVHNNLAPDNIKNMFTKLCLLSIVTGQDLLLMKITMLNNLELKI